MGHPGYQYRPHHRLVPDNNRHRRHRVGGAVRRMARRRVEVGAAHRHTRSASCSPSSPGWPSTSSTSSRLSSPPRSICGPGSSGTRWSSSCSGGHGAHWILRTFSVIALIFSMIAAFTVVNQNYDYYPTLAPATGQECRQLRRPAPAEGHPGRGPTHRQAPDPRRDHLVDHPGHRLQVQDRAGLRLPAPGVVQESRAPAPPHRADRGCPGRALRLDPGRLRRHDLDRLRRCCTTGSAPISGHPRQQREPDQRQRVLQQRTSEMPRPTWSRTCPRTCRPSSTRPSASTPWPWPDCPPVAPVRRSSPSAIRQVFSTFASYSGYASPTYQTTTPNRPSRSSTAGRRPTTRPTIPVNLLTGNRYRAWLDGSPPAKSDPQPLAACDSCRPGQEDRDAGVLRPHRRARIRSRSGPPPSASPSRGCRGDLGLTPPPTDVRAECVPPIP